MVKKLLFAAIAIGATIPYVTAPMALVCGIVFSFTIGNPWPKASSVWTKKLLQLSVTCLGFGIGLGEVWNTGRSALPVTICSITLTLAIGILLGRLYCTSRNTATLISFGTAICGGSAIAAMAPVVRSSDDETAVSLATIFTLNAVALLIFPRVGYAMGLSQHTFGLWAALAIHDTSSVVGATSAFGATALAVGTTVKLVRAVWIAPFSFGAAFLNKSEGKPHFPLFIICFLAAAALRTSFPHFDPLWMSLAGVGKHLLVVTLFLIGSALTPQLLKRVGFRPLALGITLWAIVSLASLFAIMAGIIR